MLKKLTCAALLPVQQGYYWKRNIQSSSAQPAVFSLEVLVKLLARKKYLPSKNKKTIKQCTCAALLPVRQGY